MFLKRILDEKEKEVQLLQQQKAAGELQIIQPADDRRSLSGALNDAPQKFGLIAEVKKASPSQGVIRDDFHPVEIAKKYEAAGANAISVLTDAPFFQGDLAFLQAIRQKVQLPLLRKDFIIDRLQVEESVTAGADAILLIVAALSRKQLVDLSSYAHELGLQVLVEIHRENELAPALAANPDVIGINNRDLHTFDVSLDVTRQVYPLIPERLPVISESGVSHPDHVTELDQLGLSGILVGEYLMRQDDVGKGLRFLRGELVR